MSYMYRQPSDLLLQEWKNSFEYVSDVNPLKSVDTRPVPGPTGVSLSRVREILGEQRPGSYEPLPDSHPLLRKAGAKGSPPVGRHSRTPPAQLPRIDTPPKLRQGPIRGSKYDIVPPVNKPRKQAFEKPTNGYDSWGEEGDSDSSEDLPYHPQFPYPYPYPYYPHAPVFYPGPIIMPPGGSFAKPKASPRAKVKKKVRYRDDPTYLEGKTPHPQGYIDGGRPHSYNDYMAPHFSYIAPHQPAPYDPFDPNHNPMLRRYQGYANRRVVSAEDSTIRDRKSRLGAGAAEYLDNNPRFAHKYTDSLVADFLEEEIIPDLLIDVIAHDKGLPRDHPYHGPSTEVIDDLVNKEVQRIVKDIVMENTNELVDSYLANKISEKDPVEDWLNQLISDVVNEGAIDVTRATVSAFVSSHMDKAEAYDVLMDLVSDHIDFSGPKIVREAIFEVLVEDVVEKEVMKPELRDNYHDIAKEVLTHYDSKIRRRELREVTHHASDKLIDSFVLEYLLSLYARQGKMWTENDHANRFLASLMLNILLEQFFGVRQDKKTTVENKPLRRLHEKMVTDVALDVLLNELGQSLDEDMGDLDDYERGYDTPTSSLPSSVHQWLFGR